MVKKVLSGISAFIALLAVIFSVLIIVMQDNVVNLYSIGTDYYDVRIGLTPSTFEAAVVCVLATAVLICAICNKKSITKILALVVTCLNVLLVLSMQFVNTMVTAAYSTLGTLYIAKYSMVSRAVLITVEPMLLISIILVAMTAGICIGEDK